MPSVQFSFGPKRGHAAGLLSQPAEKKKKKKKKKKNSQQTQEQGNEDKRTEIEKDLQECITLLS
jgi:hypothetical protein